MGIQNKYADLNLIPPCFRKETMKNNRLSDQPTSIMAILYPLTVLIKDGWKIPYPWGLIAGKIIHRLSGFSNHVRLPC